MPIFYHNKLARDELSAQLLHRIDVLNHRLHRQLGHGEVVGLFEDAAHDRTEFLGGDALLRKLLVL